MLDLSLHGGFDHGRVLVEAVRVSTGDQDDPAVSSDDVSDAGAESDMSIFAVAKPDLPSSASGCGFSACGRHRRRATPRAISPSRTWPPRTPVAPKTRMVGSATVVKGDLVAIGVGEREGAPEGTVDRGRHDRPTGSDQSVVDGLRVGGVQPQRQLRSRAAEPRPGRRPRLSRAAPNAIGLVPNTTACGGPAWERFSPRYCS